MSRRWTEAGKGGEVLVSRGQKEMGRGCVSEKGGERGR